MAATNLNQVARAWLARQITGVTPQTSLEEIKRRYYSIYVGGDQSTFTLAQLEDAWLRKYIATNGSPTTAKYPNELWAIAVSTIGKTPFRFLNDNKSTFYLNAP